MSLQAYYDSLPPEEQALQFGLAGGDPLGHAFPRKRVVHAGLSGKSSPRPSRSRSGRM